MRQRAMIAMALSCHPQLLIADEPTTALDVTIQAQILDLLRSCRAELGMVILIITHDLGIIAEMADEVAVMYASKIVEHSSVEAAIQAAAASLHAPACSARARPRHVEDQKAHHDPRHGPQPVTISRRLQIPSACPFAQDRCRVEEPALREIDARTLSPAAISPASCPDRSEGAQMNGTDES